MIITSINSNVIVFSYLVIIMAKSYFYEYHSFFVIIDICVNSSQHIYLKALSNSESNPRVYIHCLVLYLFFGCFLIYVIAYCFDKTVWRRGRGHLWFSITPVYIAINVLIRNEKSNPCHMIPN